MDGYSPFDSRHAQVTYAYSARPTGAKGRNAMKKKVKFDNEGYQSDIRHIGGGALPSGESRRLTANEQKTLGVPTAEAVLETLRSKPERGTPSRTGSALPARKALRLNQRDFAKLIGSSPATVRNWEQGRTPIPRMARKLLRVVERHPNVIRELADTEPN